MGTETRTEPQTEAGKRLFARLWAVNDYQGASMAIATVQTDIVAIEREAARSSTPLDDGLSEAVLSALRSHTFSNCAVCDAAVDEPEAISECGAV
jgi:hypothetical protein